MSQERDNAGTALRAAVDVVKLAENSSVTYVTRTGPVDLRNDSIADAAYIETLGQIEVLQAAHRELSLAIAAKQAICNDITNRKTPILLLPPEILSIILIEGCRMSMDMIPVPRPRKYLDPFNGAQTPERIIDTTRYILSVSQVCRKWKKSVWNTSALWAFISLNWSVAQRDIWIQRLPPRRGIDVSGYNIDLYTPKPSGEIGAFLRLNAQRIKSLTLVSCNLSLLRDFTLALALPTSSPSIIESIEIKNDEHDVMLFGPWGDRRVYYPGAEQQTLLNDVRVPDQHLWPAQTTPVDIAARLPHLRSFTMWPRSIRLNGMLHNVTRLDLALPLYSTWSQWVTVLSEPEQLESLIISSQDTVSDEEEDLEPLVLQHLRTLDIGTASHVGFVGVFLGRVQAPALHFLKFLLPRSTPQSAQSTALIQVMSTFLLEAKELHHLWLRASLNFSAQVISRIACDGLVPQLKSLFLPDPVHFEGGSALITKALDLLYPITDENVRQSPTLQLNPSQPVFTVQPHVPVEYLDKQSGAGNSYETFHQGFPRDLMRETMAGAPYGDEGTPEFGDIGFDEIGFEQWISDAEDDLFGYSPGHFPFPLFDDV